MPLEFPDTRNAWKFDIVGLLTVIGESAMSLHSQLVTASYTCLLPRLVPAPQAFIKTSRHFTLPSKAAIVIGAYSGSLVHSLHYFANLLYPIDELKAYSVHELSIAHNRTKDASGCIYIRRFAPLKLVTVCSFIMTIGLLVWSIVIHDGVAFFAILLISVASSILSLSSLWTPKVRLRKVDNEVPRGDMVVNADHGAFVVVHCSEEIARELYVGKEECEYKVAIQPFRMLVGLGTLLYMVSVVLMSNCSWTMQVSLGVAYIILNGVYWALAMVPLSWYWDLPSRYVVEKNRIFETGNYTEAVWRAIYVSGSTKWVEDSKAIPMTTVWKDWLDKAGQNIKDSNWDAKGVWNRLNKANNRNTIRPPVLRTRNLSV
jgi:hypothetical protein